MVSLDDLYHLPNELGVLDRRQIVEQAIALLEQVYVHRPQKESMHAINPLQRLRLLRDELERLPADLPLDKMPMCDLDFHRRMVSIFTSLRDLHTSYLLPEPFNHYLVYLPFVLELCRDGGAERFIVTKLIEGGPGGTFQPGVEVLYWNGVPIQRAIELNGELQAGSNSDARFARGLLTLTIRPLVRSLPPDEKWVVVTYRTAVGNIEDKKVEWQVKDTSQPDEVREPGAGVGRYRATALYGIDIQAALINAAQKMFFAEAWIKADQTSATDSAMARGREIIRLARASGQIPSDLPTVLRAYPIADGRYGYLRIFTFDVVSPTGFVDECQRLLKKLPPDGLVIDVRGNPGGNILAAEKLLQLLTPKHIQPTPMQFINTRLTLALCEQHRESTQPGLTLAPWMESIRDSVQTGAPYSTGVSITPEWEVNDIGQQYYGPVVLITDPLCYSATDIFAASFQDHQIGAILGVGGRTGAGGANVWEQTLLELLLRGVPSTPFVPLPRGCGMTVAIRRCVRVGEHAGTLLEDYGVVPTPPVYQMTRQDILKGNDDLIREAVHRLDELTSVRPPRVLKLSDPLWDGHQLTYTLTISNIVRVDLWVDNYPLPSLQAQEVSSQHTSEIPINTPRWLRASGFASLNSAEPVAMTRARIRWRSRDCRSRDVVKTGRNL